MRISEVAPSTIKAERLQTRKATNSDCIDEYAERMIAGDTFPPIVIFSDGKESWLPDGIHRLDGAIKAKKKIRVEWRKGTRADAVEYACGANVNHGLKLTNEDKRRKIEMALKTWPERSSRALAGLCCVSDHLVERIRKESQPSQTSQVPTAHLRSRNGSTRVGNDGKKRGPAIKIAPEPEEEAEPEPEKDPNSLEAVQADLQEFRKRLKALAHWGRQILGCDGNDIKRPYCGCYSVMTLIDPLNHVARVVANELPVGGTAKKPILFREEKAASLASK